MSMQQFDRVRVVTRKPMREAGYNDRWTEKEEATLRLMVAKCATRREIAEAVGRSQPAVRQKMVKLQLIAGSMSDLGTYRGKVAARRIRPCLTCDEPFKSEGAHNRMCVNCRRMSE